LQQRLPAASSRNPPAGFFPYESRRSSRGRPVFFLLAALLRTKDGLSSVLNKEPHV